MMATSDTTSRRTCTCTQNVNSERILQRMQNAQERKRHKKKETSNFNASDLLASDTIGRRTLQNVYSKRRLQRIQNLQEGKRHYKKHTSKF
jgi:hypothetical protein